MKNGKRKNLRGKKIQDNVSSKHAKCWREPCLLSSPVLDTQDSVMQIGGIYRMYMRGGEYFFAPNLEYLLQLR